MKKLSISVFSLLAIVFAISSAFTSAKKAADFVPTYEIFNVNPDVVAVASGLSEAQYTPSNLDQDLATIYSPISQTQTINQWITAIDPSLSVNDFCQTADSDHVCLVKFEKESGVVTDVLEFKAGDRITQ